MKLPRYVRLLKARVNYLYSNIHKYGYSCYAKFARRLKTKLAILAMHEEERIAKSKNRKRFFKHCNAKLRQSDDIAVLKNGNSTVIDDCEKANLFADYFESIYKEPSDRDFILVSKTNQLLDWIDLSNEKIYSTLRKLPDRNSTTPDLLPYSFLKKSALGLTTPLTLLFNKFMLLGDVPDIWKLGLVRPIFKKGNRTKVF